MNPYDKIKICQSDYLKYLSQESLSGKQESDQLLFRVADFMELIDFVKENHIANYARLIDRLMERRPELLDTAVNQYPEQIMKYLENNY